VNDIETGAEGLRPSRKIRQPGDLGQRAQCKGHARFLVPRAGNRLLRRDIRTHPAQVSGQRPETAQIRHRGDPVHQRRVRGTDGSSDCIGVGKGCLQAAHRAIAFSVLERQE
jgi:hypothetical protein